jgi:hypothetical protein
VRRDGVDPATGTRYLEELAFEVVNEQSLRDITEQAEDLAARGERREVAIFAKKGEVCEWSGGAWKKLDPGGTFTDRTLARPLRVKELLDAAEADNAVARALLAKNNPVLAAQTSESRQQGVDEGRRQGLAAGIEATCEVLGIEMTGERRRRMEEMELPRLEALLTCLRKERRWP